MLMQSVGGIIRVFPAWPKTLDGRFAHLSAEGGFLVSAEQKAAKVVKLEITSTVGGRLRLLDPWAGKITDCKTKAGERLSFTENGSTR
jgi:alpha-L-fucosidase 2